MSNICQGLSTLFQVTPILKHYIRIQSDNTMRKYRLFLSSKDNNSPNFFQHICELHKSESHFLAKTAVENFRIENKDNSIMFAATKSTAVYDGDSYFNNISVDLQTTNAECRQE